MPGRADTLRGWLPVGLGLFWSWMGVSKLVEVCSGASRGDWSGQFPVGLVACVCVLELLAAWWLMTCRAARGLSLALLLLAVYSVALMVHAPLPGQACGCGVPLGAHPLARNALLSGVHGVVAAMTFPPRSGLALKA